MFKRLTSMLVAVVLTMGCITTCFAEDKAPPKSEPSGGAVAGAIVSDIIYIPGKAATCVIGAGLWTVTMVITFGTIYRDAGEMVVNACGGKWVLTGEDMMGIGEQK